MVELHAGDRVPADLRIAAMKTATLRAEQSSLTGESVAVNKGAAPGAEEGCELQARCLGYRVGMPGFRIFVDGKACHGQQGRRAPARRGAASRRRALLEF